MNHRDYGNYLPSGQAMLNACNTASVCVCANAYSVCTADFVSASVTVYVCTSVRVYLHMCKCTGCIWLSMIFHIAVQAESK